MTVFLNPAKPFFSDDMIYLDGEFYSRWRMPLTRTKISVVGDSECLNERI